MLATSAHVVAPRNLRNGPRSSSATRNGAASRKATVASASNRDAEQAATLSKKYVTN